MRPIAWTFCLVATCWTFSANAAERSPLTLEAFLSNYCTACHGPSKQEGGLRLDKVKRPSDRKDEASRLGESNNIDAELWHAVFERLVSREMPPDDSPQPADKQREAAIGLVKQELEKSLARSLADGEWAFPSQGNALPHEWLFPKSLPGSPSREPKPDPTWKAASPPRIWRIGPQAYRQNTDELTRGFVGVLRGKVGSRGNAVVPSPFGLTTDPGFRDYAFRYRVAGSEVEQIARNAQMTVELMLTQRGPRKPPIELSSILKADFPPTDKQIETAIAYMFQAALRRDPKVGRLSESSEKTSQPGEPSNNELKRYREFTRRHIERLGVRKGLRLGLAAVLMHPEAVFRLELGRGEPDEFGRVMLSPLELAMAISYSLTDRRPDETLMKAVGSGQLETREDVAREVQRILANQEIAKPRILRFFQEYFGYTAAPAVFKDDHIIKEAGFQKYYPERLVEDTDRLVLDILEKDRQILRELLTTDLSFVGVTSVPNWVKFTKRRQEQAKAKGIEPAKHPFDKKNKLNEHYNFSPEDWSVEMPLQLSNSQRAGILTQPSWLIAHSTNEHNHAILRGKWIRERLLGGRIPDTPITVDAQLPEEPEKTLRHRMRVTREEYCWRCHQRMDPLGLPFQMFDHFGRFREREKGKAVVPSGEIIASGETKLDGPVTNAVDLIHRLAKSERVEQVFVRHAFRYWMGRNEVPSDAEVIQSAWRDYRKNDGSMNALIVSLLTSDAFLYRRVDEGKTK